MKTKFLSAAMLCIGMLLPVNAQVIAFSMTEEAANQNTPDGWTAVDLPTGIPSITAANTFYLTDAAYGASTSAEDNTSAIQAALDAAANAGGGMVVIPAGTFVSGYLTVGSKTVLHLCANATLKLKAMSTFPKDDNGYYKMDSPFITGKTNASDIVIEGESRETSIIDGQGAPWWDEVETAKVAKKSTTRSALIRFWQGQRYLFRNFRIQNAPNTNITIGRSGKGAHATAHAITIKNPASHDVADPSHNTDGFPVWTQYVNIYDCEIDTGDDNIVCDQDAQYVHVWDCDLLAGHGASFGSYTTNMHDIIYENLTLNGTDAGFRLKSNNYRSGDVYNIIFRNCTMTNVLSPISITCWYDSLPKPEWIEANAPALNEKTPRFHDITVKDVTISGCKSSTASGKNGYGIFIYGRPESYVKDVTFDNVNISHTKGLKLNFCSGIKFKDCSIQVGSTASTEDELPGALVEEQYKGNYSWNGKKPVKQLVLYWQDGMSAASTIEGDEGWTLTLTHSDATKKWGYGNGNITYGGHDYTTLKNSNGAPNTVTLAAGQKAAKVDFYATTNNATTKGALQEFNGSECNDEVSSLQDYTDPTVISKTLTTPANCFTFKFGGKQVCFIAVVTLADEDETPTGEEEMGSVTATAVRSEKILRDGQILIIHDGRTYNALGMEIK